MKKLALISILIIFAGCAIAQVHTPHKTHNPEPLEFRADFDVEFTVYVNGVIQNHTPAKFVLVNSPINNDNTTILVQVEDGDRIAGLNLHLRRKDAHGLYYIVYENNVVDVYDEEKYEQYLAHHNLHHNGSYGSRNNHFGNNSHNHNYGSNQHNSHNNHYHNDHTNDHCPYAAVTPDEFSHILSSIAYEAFDDSRLKLARSIFSTHYFTAVQIKTIAEKFTFSKNRMTFAQMAYSHCVDKSDFYVVVDAFTFKSDKDKLNKFIQRQR